MPHTASHYHVAIPKHQRLLTIAFRPASIPADWKASPNNALKGTYLHPVTGQPTPIWLINGMLMGEGAEDMVLEAGPFNNRFSAVHDYHRQYYTEYRPRARF